MGLGVAGLTRTIVSHFVGVGDKALVKKAIKKCLFYQFLHNIGFCIIFYFIKEYIASLFFSDLESQQILSKCYLVACFHLAFYILTPVINNLFK